MRVIGEFSSSRSVGILFKEICHLKKLVATQAWPQHSRLEEWSVGKIEMIRTVMSEL